MRCSACKQEKKIVTGKGGLPLCEDCLPLVTNTIDSLEKRERDHQELLGFAVEIFDTGNIDADDELEELSHLIQKIKFQLVSVEVLLTNLSKSIESQNEQKKVTKTITGDI